MSDNENDVDIFIDTLDTEKPSEMRPIFEGFSFDELPKKAEE